MISLPLVTPYNLLPWIELVFTVVSKRIQQRFFQTNPNQNLNCLTNPPSGTVVDNVVTRSNLFDFFLVPQSVERGTVTPVHYNVLEFNTTITADHLQKIAYKLSFAYWNWTGRLDPYEPLSCLGLSCSTI
eukprot:sb/3475128/